MIDTSKKPFTTLQKVRIFTGSILSYRPCLTAFSYNGCKIITGRIMLLHSSEIKKSQHSLLPKRTFSISRYRETFLISSCKVINICSFLFNEYRKKSLSLFTISRAASGSLIVNAFTEFKLLNKK